MSGVGGEAVRFFQALGDGTRLELLERLRDGERTVGELVEALRCPQPKVSRHLKVLREAGLVTDRKEGRHVTYALTSSRGWGSEARRWLAVLDADVPRSGPRGRRRNRPEARPSVPTATVPDSRPEGGPPQTASPPPASRPSQRRSDMETHLL